MPPIARLIAVVSALLALSCSSSTERRPDSPGPVRTDDISNQFVYAIAEDGAGQIWFGTFRGLNRYNSRDFFQYFASGDSLSIPDNQIRSLVRTAGDEFYAGTVQGLARYTDRDEFETIDMGGRYIIHDIVEMADTSLMIRANNSLHSLQPGGRKSRRLLDNLCPGSFYFINLHTDADNRLWIVGENSIRLYDAAANALADSIATGMFCRNSFKAGDSELWLAGDRLRRFDMAEGRFVPLPQAVASHPVLSRAAMEIVHPYGDDGLLLLTSGDGMFLYDRATQSVKSQADADFPVNVPEFKIKTMFTDSNGNLWFGSHDQGIDVHYHYTDRFNRNRTARSAVAKKSVVSTAVDKNNNLWMATRNDGIYVLRGDETDGTDDITRITIDRLTSQSFGYDEYIKNIFVDSQGYIWITLTNSEVLKCTFEAGKLDVARRFNIWGVMSIAEDARGTIWLGTGTYYVHYLEAGDDDFKPLQMFHPGFTFIPGLAKFDDNNMAVTAFNNEIMLVDVDTKEVRPLPVAGNSFEKALKRTVFIPTDIIVDHSGDLWIGTIANGLLHYSRNDSTITAVDQFNGLDISAIRQDSDSCLWVSTLNGLVRYCPDRGVFEPFYARDGIGGNQFYDRSATADTAGNLYFGGTHGITSFAPREVTAKVSAPLVFQNLIVHNRAVRPGTGIIDRDMLYAPDVHLDNDNNSFGIAFVAIDYCKNPRVAYRYMLEGVDDRWIETSGSRVAYYANVNPGTYHFKVGLVGDNSRPISIKVVIKGPWWSSWWAIIVYIVIFSAIVGILIVAMMRIKAEREAVRRARREKERERHINDMNMRFFANISHEFRTPLTMIAGPVKQMCSDTCCPLPRSMCRACSTLSTSCWTSTSSKTTPCHLRWSASMSRPCSASSSRCSRSMPQTRSCRLSPRAPRKTALSPPMPTSCRK